MLCSCQSCESCQKWEVGELARDQVVADVYYNLYKKTENQSVIESYGEETAELQKKWDPHPVLYSWGTGLSCPR